ncbi:GFA family protein [Kordiimonas gwangyangensis]|uniref:GFA family protein n=1 Tax=Kordiimonas gwangyangensis TaxID=288022 RepID=UPI0003726858|nr:GFA family protein [Kordiimonas gwangyangensis]
MSTIKAGSCLCGHVRYEIDMAGSRTGNCHCRDCQKNGGGPFMTFTTPKPGKFKWIVEPEGRAQASDFAMRRFCTHCGTPMTWEHLSKDDMAVSTGTLDDPSGVEIIYEIYTKSRWPVIPPMPGVDQFRESNGWE